MPEGQKICCGFVVTATRRVCCDCLFESDWAIGSCLDAIACCGFLNVSSGQMLCFSYIILLTHDTNKSIISRPVWSVGPGSIGPNCSSVNRHTVSNKPSAL